MFEELLLPEQMPYIKQHDDAVKARTVAELLMSSANAAKAAFIFTSDRSVRQAYHVLYDEYEILIDDFWLVANGIMMGGASLKNEIVVSYSTMINDDLAPFIIYHEVGHIELGHSNITKAQARTYMMKRAITQLWKVDQRELDADKFAASKIGKENAIKALELLREMRKGTSTEREVKMRIKALQNTNIE